MPATWPTLSARQVKAFTQTFDIYRPTQTTTAGSKNRGPMRLVASAVPGRLGTKSESTDLTPIGRGNVEQMDTTDQLRMPELLDGSDYLSVGSGWMAQLKTGGGGENGAWYVVSGEGINRSWRAATRIYLVSRSTKPAVAA